MWPARPGLPQFGLCVVSVRHGVRTNQEDERIAALYFKLNLPVELPARRETLPVVESCVARPCQGEVNPFGRRPVIVSIANEDVCSHELEGATALATPGVLTTVHGYVSKIHILTQYSY